MSTRTSSLFVCLALAACGDGPAGDAHAERIACAVEGADEFTEDCTVERSAGAQGVVMTLSAPGGGFRRLVVTNDGHGVVAADGAEPAIVTPIDERTIEVAIGGDRYRLPAKVAR